MLVFYRDQRVGTILFKQLTKKYILPNRFQVAVLLFSNRSQMMSKCYIYVKILYNKELKKSFNDDVIYTSVLQ